MKRKQFTFYRSFFKAICRIPEGKRERILTTVIAYALDETMPQELNEVEWVAFDLIQPTLDSARVKAENGRLGGIAKGKNSKKKQTDSKKEKEEEEEIENEIEKENENEIEIEDDSLFAAFWAAYPRRTERKKAFAVWLRLRPDAKAVMQGLQKWKRSKEWTREDGRFVPSAVKWLEGEYWMYPPEDTAIPCGAVGELGEAELEAIQRVLRGD